MCNIRLDKHIIAIYVTVVISLTAGLVTLYYEYRISYISRENANAIIVTNDAIMQYGIIRKFLMAYPESVLLMPNKKMNGFYRYIYIIDNEQFVMCIIPEYTIRNNHAIFVGDPSICEI
jgi:hypothetical protein